MTADKAPAKTVIAIGAQPSKFAAAGRFVDGQTPVAHDVQVTFDDDQSALLIDRQNHAPIVWPFVDIRRVRDQAGAGHVLLGRAGTETARLEVAEADAVFIRTRAHNLDRQVSRVRRGRLAVLATAAVASVAIMIYGLIPVLADRLANTLPPEGEAALGDATFEQIRTALDQSELGIGLPVCDSPDGIAALDQLTAQLLAAAPDDLVPVTVRVLDHPMINAFALPGGQVVLFRGLIDAAETPDEVAAVVGHEIGHVAARDPTRIALRSAGSIGVLGLLFGDFAGGAMMLFLAERIVQADYTQEAEAAADAFGSELLLGAGASPEALATFFERLADTQGGPPEILKHFLAHPAMADRIAAARDAAPEGLDPEPILDADGWADLQAICDA